MVKKIVYSDVQIAEHLGTSEQTIRNWRKLGAPLSRDKGTDIDELLRWHEENKETLGLKKLAKSAASTSDNSEELDLKQLEIIERTEHTKIKRQLSEFQLQLKRGELMLTEDANQSNIQMASEIKKHLLSIPQANADRIMHITSEAEAKATLEEIIKGTLKLLHRGK